MILDNSIVDWDLCGFPTETNIFHLNFLETSMISVRDLEIRIGARVLMSGVNFRVDKGDKVGLVGRNGAGKTTLTKILAGDGQPSQGFVDRGGEIGYLPQDPRSGDPEE